MFFTGLKLRFSTVILSISEMIIRKDTEKLDNKEFDENAKLPTRRSAKKCCKEPE